MTINEQQNHFRLSFCPGPVFLPACNEARRSLLQPVTASDAHIPVRCWTQGQTDILAAGFFVRSCRIAHCSPAVLSALRRDREDDHVICFDLPDSRRLLTRGIFFQGFFARLDRKELQSGFLGKPAFFSCPSPKGNFHGRMDFTPQLFSFIDHGLALYEDE